MNFAVFLCSFSLHLFFIANSVPNFESQYFRGFYFFAQKKSELKSTHSGHSSAVVPLFFYIFPSVSSGESK